MAERRGKDAIGETMSASRDASNSICSLYGIVLRGFGRQGYRA